MSDQQTTTRPKRHRNQPDAETAEATPAVADKPQRVKADENEVHAERTAKKAKTKAEPTEEAALAPKKAAPKEAAKAKAAAAPDLSDAVAGSPAIEVEVGGKQRFVFELVPGEETKNYRKFHYPQGCPMVGTIYAPLGTGKVRISLEAGD